MTWPFCGVARRFPDWARVPVAAGIQVLRGVTDSKQYSGGFPAANMN